MTQIEGQTDLVVVEYKEIPAITLMRSPKRAYDEDFDEYKQEMKVMKKAQKAISCYGVTAATLTCEVDLKDNILGVARYHG